MSKFWIQHGERWTRDAEKREKKAKAEKVIRKAMRKHLKDRVKVFERLIKEVRVRGEGEDPIEWWLENILQCLEILQEEIDWLSKQEKKHDEP